MYADMAGSATSSAILGVCIICGYMLGDLVSLCFNVKVRELCGESILGIFIP